PMPEALPAFPFLLSARTPTTRPRHARTRAKPPGRRPQPAVRHPGLADGLRRPRCPHPGHARLGPGQAQAPGPDPRRARRPVPGGARPGAGRGPPALLRVGVYRHPLGQGGVVAVPAAVVRTPAAPALASVVPAPVREPAVIPNGFPVVDAPLASA